MIHECTPHCANLPYKERVYERLDPPTPTPRTPPAKEWSQTVGTKCNFSYIAVVLIVLSLIKINR